MARVTSSYVIIPVVLNLLALGAILTMRDATQGVPLIWLVIAALSAPWVGSLLLKRFATRQGPAGRDKDTDFI